jgi:hypothetical protein
MENNGIMLALFENELRKGTGVPLILLKKNVLQANDQVTNIIFDCILETKSFDPQCEDLRGDYFYEVVLNYKEKDKIYPKIIEKFENMKENEYTEMQIADFVSNMIKDSLYSKEKYYIKIDWYITKYRTEYIPGIKKIIEIDGINAIKHYAKLLGKIINDGEDHFISDYLFFEDDLFPENDIEYSIEMVKKILKEENDSNINNYLGYIARKEKEHKPNIRPSFDKIKEYYEKGRKAPFLPGWVRKATDEEIENLSYLYLKQKDSFLKCSILTGFSEIKVRVDEKYLWNELRKTRNLYYKSAIIEALINFNNAAVKDLVNQYYYNEITKISAVKAFIKYIDEKDGFLLEHYIDGLNIYEIHDIITKTIDYERIKQFDFYPMILRKLYEKNACSICRKKVIKKMIEINCLDENLLEEIELDCDKETRKMVYEYKNTQRHITGRYMLRRLTAQ